MTRILRWFGRPTGCAGVFFLLAARPALAQEGGASATDSPVGWIFRWINFAIILALIVYGLRKAAPHFRSHAGEISRKIAEGTRAREAAENRRREVQAKLAGIETEISAMRVDAKRAAEAEGERLRQMARVEADVVERAALAEIAAAERAARLELKAVAARMAVERAETLLRDEMTPQSEATLFGSFVAELERSVN